MTTRRTLLVGTGLSLAVGGCAVYDTSPGGGGGGAAPPPATGDGTVAKVADIPVGGAKIVSEQSLVVTQPAAGTFACFSAVCTHQGCLVTDVSGGTINCPCHGSRFNLDGTVAAGPAPSPLREVPITGDGESIKRA